MNFLKYSSLFLLLLMTVEGLCQVVLYQDSNIKHLQLDAFGELHIIGEDSKHYSLGINQLEETVESARVNRSSKVAVEAATRALESVDSSFVNAVSNIEIYEAATLGDVSKNQLLVSTTRGLYVITEGLPKKYFVPGIRFPSNVVRLNTGSYPGQEDQTVAMLSESEGLYVYNSRTQVIHFVDTEVVDMVFDKWNCLWYLKNNTLYHNNKFINKLGPQFAKFYISHSHQKGEITECSSSDLPVDVHFLAKYGPLFNAVSYAYSLNDSDWISSGIKNDIRLESLNTGKNTIKVKALGLNGVDLISEEKTISMSSPSLLRYLPWVLSGLSLLFGAAYFSQRRIQSQLKELEQEKERIKMSQQIDSEKQKLGLTQMNPHFLFNTLNSINGLIALKENQKARSALNRFSQMMRSVLDFSLGSGIPLSKELKFLEDYLLLEQMIRNDHFSYSIDSEADAETKIPAMIIQPFVENAILHGLKHKKESGQVNIKVLNAGKQLKVEIQDDGIGRAAASAYRATNHESAAIKIIEQRLKSLDRWSEMSIDYEDLVDESGQASGTKVSVYLPILKSGI